MLFAGMVVFSSIINAPLREVANPNLTPNPSKAPWYFLGLQEMLVYFYPWYAGVLLPTLIIVGLMAIPYVDTNPKGAGYYTLSERKFAISVYLFGFIIFWVVLITIGTFLRGANWNFFGPYDAWDPHFQRPLKNINVSEIFWVKMLKQGMPAQWYIRELPGLLMAGAFMLLGPLILAKTPGEGKRHHQRQRAGGRCHSRRSWRRRDAMPRLVNKRLSRMRRAAR